MVDSDMDTQVDWYQQKMFIFNKWKIDKKEEKSRKSWRFKEIGWNYGIFFWKCDETWLKFVGLGVIRYILRVIGLKFVI